MEADKKNKTESAALSVYDQTTKNKVSNLIELNIDFDLKKFGIVSIPPTEMLDHINRLSEQGKETQESKGLFIVKTANRWLEDAKNRPIPLMLFSEFWFESEICILFAESGVGKSILSVQIGNSISKGQQINGFKLEAKKQKVLYFDFELNDKMFEKRYSIKYQNHYIFNENFFRVEINPEKADYEENGFKTFEQYLNHSLEQAIIETGAKVLIIDNITYLKDETEKAKDALPLMKHLKALKNKYGLSILALAHTPKRDMSKQISRNDLSGSKMLYNFCDSVFTIGESYLDKDIRYIKQMKPRNTELLYDTENVILCQIEKPINFLQFKFMGFGSEREHLKQITENDKKQRIAEALELKKQGISNSEIARRYGVSEGAIRKWFKKKNDDKE